MQYKSKIDGHITHFSKHDVQNAKYNVLILHGMAEHRHRYHQLIQRLNHQGMSVYALDLRGHGESPCHSHFGYFGKKDGYLHNIEDIAGFIQMIRSESDLPLIVFAHSMGSLFARALVRQYPDSIDALILSGSPYPPIGLRSLKLALKIPASLNPTKPSQLLAKIMNKNFGRNIKNKRTDLDWLSFNKENIDQYLEDPLCNFPFTYQGYVDLFKLMTDVYVKSWKKHENDLPVLFLVGKHDPCTDFKRDGFNKAMDKMRKEGYMNIESIIYDHSRHEILNDNEKEKVTNDIIRYIDNLSL